MDESSELDGVFLGDIDGQQAAADVQIEVDRAGARWTIRKLGSTAQPEVVASADPKVRHFQMEVHRAMRRHAARTRPVVSNFKEAPRRRQPKLPSAVPCPACHGIEPAKWHCDTCEGGGKVPG